MASTPSQRYVKAGRSGAIFNKAVGRLVRMGVNLAGARVLRVRGRVSGEWRSTPVNPLRHDGADYLVSPRGHSQWVRNLRVAGEGELKKGRRTSAFTALELPDAEKPEVLRAYLRRWKWEVGVFFEGVDATATDDELLRIAPGYPVFRIQIAR
jgi:deazaflavin-dependent oxidoreductase (nitroreductase family)